MLRDARLVVVARTRFLQLFEHRAFGHLRKQWHHAAEGWIPGEQGKSRQGVLSALLVAMLRDGFDPLDVAPELLSPMDDSVDAVAMREALAELHGARLFYAQRVPLRRFLMHLVHEPRAVGPLGEMHGDLVSGVAR